MNYFPVLPYSFIVLTPSGTATINILPTQWDVPAQTEVSGSGAGMVKDYLTVHGIGFHGQLFTLDAVSPMDLHHALLMNQTTHHDPRVSSFEVVGPVPEENPDAEDDERWANEDERDDDV